MSNDEDQGESLLAVGVESVEETLYTFVSGRPLTALGLAFVFGALLAHRVFRQRHSPVEH